MTVSPGATAGRFVAANATVASSPADHSSSEATLNGPVGPLSKPVAAKNGTGGCWASGSSFIEI
ncbi:MULTISPECIES: hypothetical protein [unclassified Haladaptatus]|uniref:hypothetical protein n=1 Tax=unclassified Haladaptatus TaxID=2622732 RepID=UPI0023E76943|nr:MULTISPECIES: hypothetical protein [unclassified Haladaptatus]